MIIKIIKWLLLILNLCLPTFLILLIKISIVLNKNKILHKIWSELLKSRIIESPLTKTLSRKLLKSKDLLSRWMNSRLRLYFWLTKTNNKLLKLSKIYKKLMKSILNATTPLLKILKTLSHLILCWMNIIKSFLMTLKLLDKELSLLLKILIYEINKKT